MNFLAFRERFVDFPVISVNEVLKVAPNFNTRNLRNWQARGLIQKVRNGWYTLSQPYFSEPLRFCIANQIYKPSYVSLESALSWHGLIPEGVFSVTSVSSRKTQAFEGAPMKFTYQKLPSTCLTGFQLHKLGRWPFKVASPEKALVDFLYLHPQYNSLLDVEGLRLNPIALEELNHALLFHYAKLFDNQSLMSRVKLIAHDAV